MFRWWDVVIFIKYDRSKNINSPLVEVFEFPSLSMKVS